SIAALRVRPSAVRSRPSPAVKTIAARVPRSPNSAMSPGTVAGGVQITASSGADGRSATRGYAVRPETAAYFGLTGQTGPANPASSRLRITVAPTLWGRSDAPTTATEPGRNKNLRLRVVTGWVFDFCSFGS